MAFRPLSTNTTTTVGPARKVLLSEKGPISSSSSTSAPNTPRYNPSSNNYNKTINNSNTNYNTTNANANGPTNPREAGGGGVPCANYRNNQHTTASASAAVAAAAAAAAEEELHRQRMIAQELQALEYDLRATTVRSDQLRRKVTAQCDSQARLVTDNEDWMRRKGYERARRQAAFAEAEAAAAVGLTAMRTQQRAAEEKAAAALARCKEAMRIRDERRAEVEMMRASVLNRQTLIALEATRQGDVKERLAVVEAEISVLEQKKREQIEHMDELKAKVASTKQLEQDALTDLEQRKGVLATLQKNIDALRKIRKGQ